MGFSFVYVYHFRTQTFALDQLISSLVFFLDSDPCYIYGDDFTFLREAIVLQEISIFFSCLLLCFYLISIGICRFNLVSNLHHSFVDRLLIQVQRHQDRNFCQCSSLQTWSNRLRSRKRQTKSQGQSPWKSSNMGFIRFIFL